MNDVKPKTWVEVSKSALLSNISQFRLRVGDRVNLAAVVKSNAYGHSAQLVTEQLVDKVNYFAVDSLDEALEIKPFANDKPILILGYTLKENLPVSVENNFETIVSNLETLDLLGSLSNEKNKIIKIHFKIETGTSRQGIDLKELNNYCIQLKNYPNLQLAGVYTHFANIEDTSDFTYAKYQLDQFQQALTIINSYGFSNYLRHTASSAATIIYPETHFDMVRVGIALYGLWPATQTKVSSQEKQIQFDLKPALTWKTVVAQIKTLPAGSSVSYGCTEKVVKDTKVAVIPVGYRDGFDRKLSSVGNVLIHGKRCKILGRICMNMTIIDVDHIEDLKMEDEVVLLGKQGEESISAEELAGKIGTINYEVVTRINPMTERRLVD